MDKSISSLEGIRERLELYNEPSHTPQHIFNDKAVSDDSLLTSSKEGRKIMDEKTLPKLLVSREEVDKKIQVRIEEGQQLRKRSIDSLIEMNQAHRDYEDWSKNNANLLLTLFDTSSVADEYKHFHDTTRIPSHAGAQLGSRSLVWELDSYKEVMIKHIYQLRGICDNLEQYQTLDTLQHTFDNKEVSDNPPRTSGNDVFIVHGHDEEAKYAVARFIKGLGLKAIILDEQVNKGQTIIEKFEREANNARFAIVLLTPDDVGAPKDDKDKLQLRARQNVILELGYFLHKLGRERVCVLCKEGVERPSDIHGIVYVPMDSADEWKPKLRQEMEHAGLPIQNK